MEVLQEKNSFRSKKTSKKWVFGVFRSVLKHFAFLLYESDDTPTCRILAHSVVHSVATIKMDF